MSGFQAGVLRACRAQQAWQILGVEHPTEDGLLSIDIALAYSSSNLRIASGAAAGATSGAWSGRVAVEADGPTHFSSNSPGVALGKTLWRNRALERRGYTVLSVPHYEWDALEDAQQKAAYMGKRLQALLLAPSGSEALCTAAAPTPVVVPGSATHIAGGVAAGASVPAKEEVQGSKAAATVAPSSKGLRPAPGTHLAAKPQRKHN